MTKPANWRPDEGVWCAHESVYPDDLEDRENPFVYPESCYRMDGDTYFAIIETYLLPMNCKGTYGYRLFEGVLVSSNRIHVLVSRLQDCEGGAPCRDDWKDNLDYEIHDVECIAKIQNFADFNNYSTPTPLASAFLMQRLQGGF